MGFFSGITSSIKSIASPITSAVGSVLGGGIGSTTGGTKSSNSTTTSANLSPVTNVDIEVKPIDLVPFAEILAEGQNILSKSNEDSAKIALAAQLVNAENERLNRESAIDVFNETKKGFLYLAIGAGAIYLYTHRKAVKT